MEAKRTQKVGFRGNFPSDAVERGSSQQTKISFAERFVSGLEQTNRFVNAVLAFVLAVCLCFALLSISSLFSPSDPSRHVCYQCKKSFSCRLSKGAKKKRQNIHQFARQTVKVGSFPIEIAKPETDIELCCTSDLAKGVRQRFCGFGCYRNYQKAL
jgi:hypothetical protein